MAYKIKSVERFNHPVNGGAMTSVSIEVGELCGRFYVVLTEFPCMTSEFWSKDVDEVYRKPFDTLAFAEKHQVKKVEQLISLGFSKK